MFKMKIALCGKMRSGKDTVAFSFLEQGFRQYRFAEGIWKTIELLFPEAYENRHTEKPRRLLQELGQGIRKVDPDVWVRHTLNRIENEDADRVIVTDLRQPNEFEALRSSGFFIVRVHADDEIRIARAKASGDNFTEEDLNHETELHVDSFDVDFVIENNGTIADLDSAVNRLLEEINRKGVTGELNNGSIET